MDTKFSVALHILAFIGESEEIVTSKHLADSVGTNASHIRKITALLKEAGLIKSQQGKSGMVLAKEAEAITLADVYQAVYPDKFLLHVHKDADPNCPVGSVIEEILTPTFQEAETAFMVNLQKHNLANLIEKGKKLL